MLHPNGMDNAPLCWTAAPFDIKGFQLAVLAGMPSFLSKVAMRSNNLSSYMPYPTFPAFCTFMYRVTDLRMLPTCDALLIRRTAACLQTVGTEAVAKV